MGLLGYERLHVEWQGCFDSERFSGRGMRERQSGGMECHSRKAECGTIGFGTGSGDHFLIDFSFARVERVAQKRVTDSGEVNTDLVEAAGL